MKMPRANANGEGAPVARASSPRPAALPEPGARDVLYLVDLSGYVFRAYHALPPLSSSRGEPTHAVLGTVNMLQKIVGERRPHMLAVAMDSPGPTFRHDLDGRYKATRPAPPPDLAQQMARVEQVVRAWDVACFRASGLEADDLIAAVTARAVAEGVRVVIVSADKDLMQLVRGDGAQVVLWDTMRDRVYGPDEVREKLGVLPAQVRDYLALTGDTSDNVPGVPGVGPKTATDLLLQFESLDGIYAALDRVAKPKLRESLREHEADARLSQRLVALNAAAPIEWSRERLLWGGADLPELRRLYAELEFHRQLEQVDALARVEPPSPRATVVREPRVVGCILDVEALERVVACARAGGEVGVAVELARSASGGPRPEIRASLIGLSLATDQGHAFYVPLGHRYLGCPPQLAWAAARAIVAPLLADPKVTKVGHDLKRVAIALAGLGAPLGGPAFDVMVAAYLLDPEAPNTLEELSVRELEVALARHDEPQRAGSKGRAVQHAFDELDVERAAAFAAVRADVPLALRARFAPRLAAEGLGRLMDEVEMPLERVLVSMETAGVLVDIPTLERLGRDVEKQLSDIEADCKRIAGHDFTLRSRDQLEKILFDELKLPVVKRTPKGGRSTDADVLEALAPQHALPARVLEFRELDKLKGTYIDALPRYVDPSTGRIHTRFDQAVAATGRLSSNDPNLQNIPIRTELGRAIRAAFVAPEGHVILAADYSQIELRVLAHLSQDEQLIAAFTTGEDVHARTAALIFDKPRELVTSEERRAAKTINFGVIYGMGDSALAKQLGVSRERAAQFIEAYFARYAGVARFMERTVEAARQGEAVRTLLGRRRFLPNLHSANRALRFEAERVARNTPIQGTAADILKRAMVALASGTSSSATMVLTVHDELVFEVRERDAESEGARIRACMAGAMKLDVPLVVDVGWGASWAAAH